jgi:hypothetical protein
VKNPASPAMLQFPTDGNDPPSRTYDADANNMREPYKTVFRQSQKN